jgi:ATP-dependent Lhr-like helicase
VDASFGERLAAGDRFLLDGRCLELGRRDGDELLVREVIGRPAPPRWDGSPGPLSAALARRLYQLRVEAAEALRDGPVALASLLRHGYRLNAAAVAVLARFFQRQEIESEIPDASCLLVESVRGDAQVDWYCHTPLSRAGNDALARVAVHRLARDWGQPAASLVADLGFVLQLPQMPTLPADLVRALLAPENFASDFREALADSDALRIQFGRVARTGLMVLSQPGSGRRRVGGHDWAARRLFDQVRRDSPEFVLLRQAAREVGEQWCDVATAEEFARSLSRRMIRVRQLRRPSPFAEAWTQQAPGPEEDRDTPAEALQRLHTLLHGKGVHASAG